MTGTSLAFTSAERIGGSAGRALLRLAALGAVATLGGCGSLGGQSRPARAGTAPVPASARSQTKPPQTKPPFTIVKRYALFIDHSRFVRVPGHGRQPRRLLTVIRYPTHATGPFPLVVFGHGFAVTPAIYHRLLRAWAEAGYVVAAPVFPLGNANAPGGPNESDIVNQPRDMSFVITRLLALSASRHGWLAGLINRRQIAVSGQSDGGETALAVAYDRHYVDRRIRAAVILSGAELPDGGFDFPAASPPLLAVQGTADTINQPRYTYAFFNAARRPKFLLKLIGAPHLPPYTYEEPQLSIVERVTIAFLDHYLKGARGQLASMVSAGDVPGRAVMIARR
jgi:dienelactone hydrolase